MTMTKTYMDDTLIESVDIERPRWHLMPNPTRVLKPDEVADWAAITAGATVSRINGFLNKSHNNSSSSSSNKNNNDNLRITLVALTSGPSQWSPLRFVELVLVLFFCRFFFLITVFLGTHLISRSVIRAILGLFPEYFSPMTAELSIATVMNPLWLRRSFISTSSH